MRAQANAHVDANRYVCAHINLSAHMCASTPMHAPTPYMHALTWTPCGCASEGVSARAQVCLCAKHANMHTRTCMFPQAARATTCNVLKCTCSTQVQVCAQIDKRECLGTPVPSCQNIQSNSVCAEFVRAREKMRAKSQHSCMRKHEHARACAHTQLRVQRQTHVRPHTKTLACARGPKRRCAQMLRLARRHTCITTPRTHALGQTCVCVCPIVCEQTYLSLQKK